MARVFIQESTLTAIGNAIRRKTGKAGGINPSAMATMIYSITTGVELPSGALTLGGDCSFLFARTNWDWYLTVDGVSTNYIYDAEGMFSCVDRTGNEITSVPFDIDIAQGCNCSSMFQCAKITRAPEFEGYIGDASFMFDQCVDLETVPSLYFDNSQAHDYSNMFSGCDPCLKTIGTFTNMRPTNMSNMFYMCTHLRNLPDFVNLDLIDLVDCSNMFEYCRSLRSIPEDLLTQLTIDNGILSGGFHECYVLDEIKGLNPLTSAEAVTTNMFPASTFDHCSRAKDITFAVQENGTPYTVSWQNQIIDLSNYVGYVESESAIYGGYSGLAGVNYVGFTSVYEELKDDPDWWTDIRDYSRYNRTSAINTIKSLPDTSAYLAANGGTNTIKFEGLSGSATTDGGAINTLTASQIAVAADKGWTVAFA